MDFSPISCWKSTPRTRLLKSPRDIQSLVAPGSLFPWMHLLTSCDPLHSYSNAEFDLSSLISTPDAQKISLVQNVGVSNDLTEVLQCQREFISHNTNNFKLSVYMSLFLYVLEPLWTPGFSHWLPSSRTLISCHVPGPGSFHYLVPRSFTRFHAPQIPVTSKAEQVRYVLPSPCELLFF